MVKSLLLALGLGVFLLAGTAGAADPEALCKDAKLKATGKKAFGILKSFGKNIKKPDAVKLAEGIAKAQSKFTKGFTVAEGKGGCLTTGDAAAIEDKVDAFAADVIEELGSPSGAFIDASGGTLD